MKIPNLNLSHYKPFHYFNTESKLNLLDKSKAIKINGKTYYKIK
jgi:hypothetical protein